MSSATGNRSPRAGAHRAPKTASPPRRTEAGDTGDGESEAGVTGVGPRSRSSRGRAPRDAEPGGLRSKKTRRRALAVATVGIVVLAAFFHGGGTSPEPTVAKFLLDWELGDYGQAAALTTGPHAVVASELSGAYKQLDATDLTLSMTSISQQGTTATATFGAAIDLANTGLRWKYRGHLTLRETGQTWQVNWSPSVIVPGLGAGDRLALVLLSGPRKQIYAASGQPLTVPSQTYEIGVYPRSLSSAAITTLADRLVQVLSQPSATAGQLAGQITASALAFQELFTLTPAAYTKVRAAIRAIPGVVVQESTQPLFHSIAPDVVGEVGTETAQILQAEGVSYRPGTTIGQTGLQQAYQHQLTGTPGTGVVIENSHGVAQYFVHGAFWKPMPGKPVHTTLDYRAQLAADRAVAQVPGSAALVAVQAGTGNILAVASHDGRGMLPLDPLAGKYEPGQAFTMISAPMFLASGTTTNQPLPCPLSNGVNGHNFFNLPREPRMKQSTRFAEDFALGCSTAFVGPSERLTGADLTKAADEFGIGAPWQLPLNGDYFAGTIGQPSGSGQVGLAAATIGQGDVRVSPLSMALAAAVADSGRWSAPSLVTGVPDPKVSVRSTMSPQVLTDLRQLMREEVAHGSGTGVRAGNDVYGQAGIAPFGAHGKLFISWFVGYQGSTAFAVAELVKSPSDSAAPLAGSFLRNIHAG